MAGQGKSRLRPKGIALVAASTALQKRARAKTFTLVLAAKLADLRSPLEKSYRNSIYCAGTLNQENGKMTGKYCGNRWCFVCNRIRTARAINRYLPVLGAMDDKQLVTLSERNVSAERLPDQVQSMIDGFATVKLAMRRTDKVKLRGLRKLECTYNEERNDYHPHFHIIVETREQAKLLVARWLAIHPDTSDARGQDARACDNETLREVFKYFTKVCSKTKQLHPAALDVIFRAMRGHRVYQDIALAIPALAVDENAPIDPTEATPASERAGETIVWQWDQAVTDWVDQDTGQVLSGYDASSAFREFLERIREIKVAPFARRRRLTESTPFSKPLVTADSPPRRELQWRQTTLL